MPFVLCFDCALCSLARSKNRARCPLCGRVSFARSSFFRPPWILFLSLFLSPLLGNQLLKHHFLRQTFRPPRFKKRTRCIFYLYIYLLLYWHLQFTFASSRRGISSLCIHLLRAGFFFIYCFRNFHFLRLRFVCSDCIRPRSMRRATQSVYTCMVRDRSRLEQDYRNLRGLPPKI